MSLDFHAFSTLQKKNGKSTKQGFTNPIAVGYKPAHRRTRHRKRCAALMLFPGSSEVEQAAVNRPVGGSNPSLGAISRKTACFGIWSSPDGRKSIEFSVLIPGSSEVEQAAVNRPVGGSNPSLGANIKAGYRKVSGLVCFRPVDTCFLATPESTRYRFKPRIAASSPSSVIGYMRPSMIRPIRPMDWV